MSMDENGIRHCDECGSEMWEGYVIEAGSEYYCSSSCLYKHLTREEYLWLYDDGAGDSYYTDWYDTSEYEDRYLV